MGYGISPTCFYVTKGGLIRNPNKSELITELKSMIRKNIPTHLPPTNHNRNVIINFMVYANKKAKPKNIKRFLHQSLKHVQISFQAMQLGGNYF